MARARSGFASRRNATAAVSGHEHRRREVVRLDPLAQEVGEVRGVVVAEHEMAEGLQHDGARGVAAAGSCGR